MALLPAYRLKLYRNFKAIESADFHGVVRYYERFEDDIRGLDFDEYFDCTVAYTWALFETGAFGKHLVMADNLLETVIMQNIETWGGEDIYAKLLFKKAAALYQLDRFAESEHILRELTKMNPWEKNYSIFLKKTLLRQKPLWLPRVRNLAVLLFLGSALVIGLEVFVVRPHFAAWLSMVERLHVGMLMAGLFMLFAGECRHFWQSHQKAETFAERCKVQKMKSQR